MRLLQLEIEQHRVLSKLKICFDPGLPQPNKDRNYYLDFLVGVNGTGKSTVLRLLGQIFRGVQASSLYETPFCLEYWLDKLQKKIRIANIDLQHRTLLNQYFVTTTNALDGIYDTDIPGEPYLVDNIPDEFLPRRVIAYTTGSESEWLQANGGQDIFLNSSLDAIQELSIEDRALKELPGWPLRVERQEQGEAKIFRFVSQDELILIALSGLLLHCMINAGDNSPLKPVFCEAEIKALAGFSLKFDLSMASANERNSVWEKLGKYATRRLRSGGKFLLVFEASADSAARLLNANGGALSFFETLADWYGGENRILTEVNLFLERESKQALDGQSLVPPLHTWDWLSDGERSFLGRMCLFLLFGEVESLILLDEPEVHFNDYWKRHIVSILHQVFEKKQSLDKSHVLVATHSSISLSDVHPEDILILERQDLVTSTTRLPRIQTFGADPSEIMVHVFGTPHAAGEYSVNEIEDWLYTAFKKDLSERRNYLKERLDKIAPGYWAYRIRREMVGLPPQ